ncbi:MAG: acyltransferase [Planctomycetes bacterium]|nr:acyltransferase [Planctomycetota bacterium]
MKVAVIQTRPRFGDRKGNLERALRQMEKIEADLFLLPELFATGYLFADRDELVRLAEPVTGDTVAALREFSRNRGCWVYAGLAEAEGDKVFNSSALVARGNLKAVYRKLHLFKGEKAIFDRSENRPVVADGPEGRLGLMVCFDWIFPEMARSLTLEGAQVLCLVANLVLPFCQHAMITRSLENGVYTLLANRVGTETRGGTSLTFTGGSEIVGPRGDLLARASTDQEEVITASIEPKRADDKMITSTNHLLSDRRVDYYRSNS